MDHHSAYANELSQLDIPDAWGFTSRDVNIPHHPQVSFFGSNNREVQVSPTNGFDDGALHEDQLRFFVSIDDHVLGEFDDGVAAVEAVEQILNELSGE